MPYRFKCPRCGGVWDIPFRKAALNPHLVLLKDKPVRGMDRVLLKCPKCEKRDYQKYLGKV